MTVFKRGKRIPKDTLKVLSRLPKPSIDKDAIRHKKLLVLDIDQTLLDVTSPRLDVNDPETFLRPGVLQFLQNMSTIYDIGFWSLSTQKFVDEKLQMLDLDRLGVHPVFAIGRMHTIQFKFASKTHAYDFLAKPLQYISMLTSYNQKDILHIDDNGLCTLLSGNNVVLVRPWYIAEDSDMGMYFGFGHSVGRDDRDLEYLGQYLTKIRGSADYTKVLHTNWMRDKPIPWTGPPRLVRIVPVRKADMVAEKAAA